jgi:hypothetical protein
LIIDYLEETATPPPFCFAKARQRGLAMAFFSVFPIEQIENAELRRDSRIAERGPARQELVCPIRLFLIKSLQGYFAAHILYLKNVPIEVWQYEYAVGNKHTSFE